MRRAVLLDGVEFFGGGLFGRGDFNPFEGLDGELERMLMHPPSPVPRGPSRQMPSSPPHYSFQPSQDNGSTGWSLLVDEWFVMFV